MADNASKVQSNPVDKEAIRERYRIERDKRLRSDGNDQYTRIAGLFDDYLEDPYTPVTPGRRRQIMLPLPLLAAALPGWSQVPV